ncbi:KIR-like CYIR protein [Plasmodium cynomolgi strain B]|uniref:KIR-like CYIR protein n=1 Tax=Plasmodium cynomolgi (strain B) TaxID=1120755 RepID=K6UCG5_PLACD|nr:KIR-like CYIR protein [Plasmodium cynomolgi strain B]GAB64811.1 KIR-like CYIR protein [Plasmodium cynomolgi strain B]
MYDHFNDEAKSTAFSEEYRKVEGKLNEVLKECRNFQNVAKRITSVWYNTKMEPKKFGTWKYNCPLFYYWLGNEVSGIITENGKFGDTLKGVYSTMMEKGIGKNCEKQCPNVSKEEFQELKILHDYTLEYSGTSNMKKNDRRVCGNNCENHLRKINETYGKVLEDCKIENERDYCKEFRRLRTTGSVLKVAQDQKGDRVVSREQ